MLTTAGVTFSSIGAREGIGAPTATGVGVGSAWALAGSAASTVVWARLASGCGSAAVGVR